MFQTTEDGVDRECDAIRAALDLEEMVATIDIDMNARCIHCGKGGATPSGRCLGCVVKLMTWYGMDRKKWPKSGRISKP